LYVNYYGGASLFDILKPHFKPSLVPPIKWTDFKTAGLRMSVCLAGPKRMLMQILHEVLSGVLNGFLSGVLSEVLNEDLPRSPLGIKSG
jgi:hypothetical protein